MRQFLTASDAAFAGLERRAKAAAYINFPSAELPPGCVPPRSRVGLKVDRQSGVTTLFIERDVRYYGANQLIRRWVEHGELAFPSFSKFRRSISAELARAFAQAGTVGNTEPGARGKVEPQLPEPSGLVPRNTKACEAAIAPPTTDLVTNKLIGFLVRQIARNYGLEIESIDGPLFGQVHSKLLAAIDQVTCDEVIDDLLGGPLALASVEGHRRVNLQAGPPITCNPVPEEKP